MTDKDDVRELCAAYTFALDDGDFEEVGRLMAQAELRPTIPGVPAVAIAGQDAITAFYRDHVITYTRDRPMTRHLITNQVVSVASDGTSATSRCYFTLLQRPPGIGYHVVLGGQYFDEFICDAGGWRFSAKSVHVDHLNDTEHHFRIAT